MAEKAEKSDTVRDLSNSTNSDKPATGHVAGKLAPTGEIYAEDHETSEEPGTISPEPEEVGFIEGNVSFHSAQINAFKSLLTYFQRFSKII